MTTKKVDIDINTRLTGNGYKELIADLKAFAIEKEKLIKQEKKAEEAAKKENKSKEELSKIRKKELADAKKAEEAKQKEFKSLRKSTTAFDRYGRAVEKTTVLTRNFANGKSEVQKFTQDIGNHKNMWGGLGPQIDDVNKTLNNFRWGLVNIGFAMGALATVASPFVLLTKAGMEWELQLTKIQVVTDDYFDGLENGARTAANMLKTLRDDTPFSSLEVGESFFQYSKSGFGAEEAETAMPEIIKLATIGFTDLNTATDLTIQTMHAFSVQGVSVENVVNTIALASNKSAMNVEEFGSALRYVGPIAANLGLSLNDSATAIALLSDAGLKGSKAGTSFRQMLNSIGAPSEQARATMNRLGITYYDAEGNFKDLASMMGTLKNALADLNAEQKSEVLGDMFSIRSRVGISAFLNLIDEGEDKIRDMNNLLEDESSYATEKMADVMETSTMRMKDALNDLKDAIEPFAAVMNDTFSAILEGVGSGTQLLADFYKTTGKTGAAVTSAGAAVGAGFAIKGLTQFMSRGSSVANPMWVADVTNVGSNSKGVVTKILDKLSILLYGKAATTTLIPAETAYTISASGASASMAGVTTSTTAATGGLMALVPAIAGVVVALAALAGAAVAVKWAYNLGQSDENKVSWGDIWEGVKAPFSSTPEEYSSTQIGGTSVPSFATNIPEINIGTSNNTVDDALDFRAGFEAAMEDLMSGIEGKFNVGELKTVTGFIDNLSVAFDTLEGATREETQALSDYGYTLIDIYDEMSVLNDELVVEQHNLDLSKRAFDEQKEKVADAKDVLADYNDELKDLGTEIGDLLTARFSGQTDIEKLIADVKRFNTEQELASYGITDSYSWLQGQLALAATGFDNVNQSIQQVNDSTSDGTDTYSAWLETVQTFIRETIQAGNDLGKNVTNTVAKYGNLLLSTSKFKDETEDQSTYVGLLKDAYDVHYGGMADDVEYTAQKHEESSQKIYNSAEEVISALTPLWKEEDKVAAAAESATEELSKLNDELDIAEGEYDSYKEGVTEIKNLLSDLEYQAIKTGKELGKVYESAEAAGIQNVRTNNPVNEGSGMTDEELTQTDYYKAIEAKLEDAKNEEDTSLYIPSFTNSGGNDMPTIPTDDSMAAYHAEQSQNTRDNIGSFISTITGWGRFTDDVKGLLYPEMAQEKTLSEQYPVNISIGSIETGGFAVEDDIANAIAEIVRNNLNNGGR